MNKAKIQKRLDDVSDNFRKDMVKFFEGGQEPASATDLKMLAEMTFYAISEMGKIISEELD